VNLDEDMNSKAKGKWKNQKGKWYIENKDFSEGTSKKGANRNRLDKKKFNKKGLQCYNCQRFGHFADECYAKKMSKDDSDEVQFAHAKTDSEDVLFIAITDIEGEKSKPWYLDTSCSNHMTRNKEWFSKLDESGKRKIKFADK